MRTGQVNCRQTTSFGLHLHHDLFLPVVQLGLYGRRGQALDIDQRTQAVEVTIRSRQNDFEVAVALVELVRAQPMILHGGADSLKSGSTLLHHV